MPRCLAFSSTSAAAAAAVSVGSRVVVMSSSMASGWWHHLRPALEDDPVTDLYHLQYWICTGSHHGSGFYWESGARPAHQGGCDVRLWAVLSGRQGDGGP